MAFGSILILIYISIVRFSIYGGDVNQDGVVNATDAAIADNNAFNFVVKITP